MFSSIFNFFFNNDDDYIEYFCLRMPKFFCDWADFKQLSSREGGFHLNLDEINDRVQTETVKYKQLSWKFKINLSEVKKRNIIWKIAN